MTSVDLKHDPMFSQPPPWAAVEKIYAVVANRTERPDSSIFSVKKFGFKPFESEKQHQHQHQQQPPPPQQQQPPQPQPQQSPNFKSFFNKKSNQEKNAKEPITVTEKNDARDSVKYTVENNTPALSMSAAPAPADAGTENTSGVENIYEDPRSCDTIHVVAEEVTEEPNRDKQMNSLVQKLHSTAGKMQRNTKEKSQLLRSRIGTLLKMSRSRTSQQSTKEEDSKKENKSLLRRFVTNVKSSSVKQNAFKSLNVKNVNLPTLGKSINAVRGKLTKASDDKNKTNELKKPKILKITKANNTETYKAAPINDDLNLKYIKNKIVKYPEDIRNRFLKFPKISSRNATVDRDNNKFRDTKTKISDFKIQDLKTKVSNLRRKVKSDDDKSASEVKTSRLNFLKPKKKLDNIDNNSSKFFAKFNIRERWAGARSPTESKSDIKLKSPKSTKASNENKKARFSDDHERFNFKATSSNYNPYPKPFNAEYNGDAHKYKWNFVDGQWRKSGTVGL